MAQTTEELLQKLIEEVRGNRGSAFGSPAPGATSNPFDSTNFNSQLDKAGNAAKNFKDTIGNNMATWRELSRSGANFSNDIIGMSVAASEARLSLTEFQGVVSRNAEFLGGLGGSVTRGVEAFAKLQKEFAESTFGDNLLKLGYGFEEMSETLALQVGMQRTINMEDKAAREAAFDSAERLATEMDFLSKLTGKTRAEQEKALREQQRSMAVESKFRLIGLKEGADAEKAARANYTEQFLKAEARGQGALFQDMFTKGVPASEEAAMQLALFGKASFETAESAKALAKGNYAAADAANERAMLEMGALQNNTTLLALGTLEGLAGTAGEVVGETLTSNRAFADSIASVQKNGESLASAIAKITADIQQSQSGNRLREGSTTEYENVQGATQAIIDAEQLYKDTTAGFMGMLTKSGEKYLSVAEQLNTVGIKFSQTAESLGNVSERMVSTYDEVRDGKTDSALANGLGDVVNLSTNAITDISIGFLNTFESVFRAKDRPIYVEDVSKVDSTLPTSETDTSKDPEYSLATGTPGVTGSVFHDFNPAGELAILHGTEAVLTPDQLDSIVAGSYETGIQESVNKMVSKMLNVSNSSPASKQQQSNLLGPVKISGITQVQVHGVPTVKLNDEFMTGIKTVVSGDEAAESNTSSKTSESNTSAAAQPSREQQVSETEAKFLKIGEEQGAEAEKIARDTAKIREKEKTALLATLKQDRDPERFTGIDASLQELLKKQEAKDDAAATAEFTELFDNATAMLDKVVKVKGDQDETAKQITARYAVDLEKAKNEGNVTEFLKSFVKESEASIEKPESMFSGGKLNLDGLYGTGLDNFTHGKANTAKWVEPKEDQARQSTRAAGQREKTEEEKLAEETRATSSNATVPEFDSGVGYSAEQLTSNMQKSNESLNDLGSKLDQLNSSIVKLTTQQKELSDKQIRAIKANNTRDVNVAVS